MRTQLSERLLLNIMGWSPDKVADERPLIEAIAKFKYNEYQQFSPGIRFVESLVRWIKQFDTTEEKLIAYNFILDHSCPK
jgi:hypothetical protein